MTTNPTTQTEKKTKPAATLAKLLANRRNAQRSTGPRTPRGKARAARNALRHGLCSARAVIPGESRAEYVGFTARLRAELAPADEIERFLANQAVHAAWRMRRAQRYERQLVERVAAEVRKRADEPYGREPYSDGAVTYGAFRWGQYPGAMRYESQVTRAFYKAMGELKRRQANREPDTGRPETGEETAKDEHENEHEDEGNETGGETAGDEDEDDDEDEGSETGRETADDEDDDEDERNVTGGACGVRGEVPPSAEGGTALARDGAGSRAGAKSQGDCERQASAKSQGAGGSHRAIESQSGVKTAAVQVAPGAPSRGVPCSPRAAERPREHVRRTRKDMLTQTAREHGTGDEPVRGPGDEPARGVSVVAGSPEASRQGPKGRQDFAGCASPRKARPLKPVVPKGRQGARHGGGSAGTAHPAPARKTAKRTQAPRQRRRAQETRKSPLAAASGGKRRRGGAENEAKPATRKARARTARRSKTSAATPACLRQVGRRGASVASPSAADTAPRAEETDAARLRQGCAGQAPCAPPPEQTAPAAGGSSGGGRVLCKAWGRPYEDIVRDGDWPVEGGMRVIRYPPVHIERKGLTMGEVMVEYRKELQRRGLWVKPPR